MLTVLLLFFCVISENEEEQAQERVDKILKEEEVRLRLCSAGVGVVSCVIQRDEERTPIRHSFHWSMEKQYYAEEPMLRHLEHPLSIYLELVMITTINKILV